MWLPEHFCVASMFSGGCYGFSMWLLRGFQLVAGLFYVVARLFPCVFVWSLGLFQLFSAPEGDSGQSELFQSQLCNEQH